MIISSSFYVDTKAQWARDDPAFLVLLSLAMFGKYCIQFVLSLMSEHVVLNLLISPACAAGFSIVLGLSFLDFLKLVSWLVFFDCVACGVLIATALWWFANRFLLVNAHANMEWAYAFDVHLNAFFPFLLLVHAVQLPFLSFLVLRSALAVFLGNSCWLTATSYYLYVTFLGYSNLPFLRNTRVFLTPFTVLVLAYAVSLVFLWNATACLVNFYQYRLG